MVRFLRIGALAALAACVLAIPFLKSTALTGVNVPVIVQLRDDPGAVYAARAKQSGTALTAEQMQAYQNGLLTAQNQFLEALKNRGVAVQPKSDNVPNALGTTTPVQLRYTLTFNGMALSVPASALSSIAAMPQVKAVFPDSARKLQLDKSVDYIRAPEAYGQVAELSPDYYTNPVSPADPYEGQGMKVAVIDTGVDWTHPMFGSDNNPPRLGVEPAPVGLNRNQKVIYYLPLADGLIDDFGHGTHTSADIAGYLGFAPGADGIPNTADDVKVHGVAPQARLMDYKVCNAAGTCLTSDILMAIDDAVSPRTVLGDSKPVADVINMSIGGIGSPDSAEAIASDNAASLGTIVVASAGNSGVELGSLGAPAAGRRVIAVGADTDPGSTWPVDVLDPSTVNAGTTGAVTPASNLAGAAGQRSGIKIFPMAGTPDPAQGSMAQYYVFVRNGQTVDEFPTNVRGRIALVSITNPRATSAAAFGQIANNAAAAGAVACLFVSNTDSPTAVRATIPSANISVADGAYLESLIPGYAAGPPVTHPASGAVSSFPIRLNPFFRSGYTGDMAGFSSRGPVAGYGQVKPDVTAPGVRILSATSVVGAPAVSMADPTRYTVANGTSFSGPHVAGSVALIKQAHRNWSPDVIRTVLINTATNLRDQNRAPKADGPDSAESIIAQGGGLVDVYRSISAKALMGVTGDGIIDPSILGSKSFGEVPVVNNRITSTQSVTVTIQDLSGQGGSYNIGVANNRDLQTNGINVTTSGSNVALAANGSATFTVNATFDGNLIRDRFISEAIVNGNSITFQNRPMELQWFVTAQSSDGSQTLRMPFYFKPVRSFAANPAVETTSLSGTILAGSTGSEAADPVDYTDISFQVDDRTFKIQANLSYDDTVNGLDLYLIDPSTCDPTAFCDNKIARTVPVNEQGQSKRQLNYVVDHPGTYIYRVSGDISGPAMFTIESRLLKGGLAPTMQPIQGEMTNANGDPIDFDGTFNVQWTPNGGEQGFEIETSTDNQNWEILADVGAGTTSYNLSDQGDGTYYFRVRGLNPGQIGSYVTTASSPTSITVNQRVQVDATTQVSWPFVSQSYSAGVSHWDVVLVNNGTQTYLPFVDLNIVSVTSPSGTVRVLNADNGKDGKTAANAALFHYTQTIGDDQAFTPNETTAPRTMNFQNTRGEGFFFDAVVTAYVGTGSGGSSSPGSGSSTQQSSSPNSSGGIDLTKITTVRRTTYNPITKTATSQLISLK